MSGIPRRALDAQVISPDKLILGLRENKFFYGRWYGPQPRVTNLDGFSAPLLADTNVNLVQFVNGPAAMNAAQYLIGTRAADVALWNDAVNDWLETNPEPALSEGVQYTFGAAVSAANPFSTTIGDDTVRNKGNRRILLNHQFQTAANVDEFAVGFRKAENAVSAIESYTDYAVLTGQYDTDGVYIRTETRLNSGTVATTDLPGSPTLAADTDAIFEVRLIGGVPRFFYNGEEFNVDFEFDSGDVIIPFAFFLCNATGSSEWRWKELAVGDEADFNESLQF